MIPITALLTANPVLSPFAESAVRDRNDLHRSFKSLVSDLDGSALNQFGNTIQLLKMSVPCLAGLGNTLQCRNVHRHVMSGLREPGGGAQHSAGSLVVELSENLVVRVVAEAETPRSTDPLPAARRYGLLGLPRRLVRRVLSLHVDLIDSFWPV